MERKLDVRRSSEGYESMYIPVAEHEDLQRKYDQNQKQYEELALRLKETEEQLSTLQNVLEPVYDEFNDIETKLSLEQSCRSKAEEYASQVVKQNKKLKRQSQYLMQQLNNTQVNIVDIPFEDEPDSVISEPEDQSVHLNRIIEELQNEVVALKHKNKKLEEEKEGASEREQHWRAKYENEVELHKRTQTSLQQHEASLKQFHRVSTRAFVEFQDLKERYEEEKTLKEHAIKNAVDSMKERKVMARESAILLNSVADNERLTKALMEIETLTRTLETERNEYEGKIEDLEEIISNSKDKKQLEEYDEKLQTSFEEIDRLQRQCKDQEAWSNKLQKEVEELTAKLKDAEDRLKPPPPPPPPPPPVGFLQPLKQLIRGSKKTAAAQNAKQKDEKAEKYRAALDEMMARIRSGKTGLQSATARRPSAPDDMPGQRGAMEEMNAILLTLKKRRPSADDILDHDCGDSNNNQSADDLGEKSELEKIYLRVRGDNVKKNLSPITEESSSEVSHL